GPPRRAGRAGLDEDILRSARSSQGLERADRIKHIVLEVSGGLNIVPKQGLGPPRSGAGSPRTSTAGSPRRSVLPGLRFRTGGWTVAAPGAPGPAPTGGRDGAARVDPPDRCRWRPFRHRGFTNPMLNSIW